MFERRVVGHGQIHFELPPQTMKLSPETEQAIDDLFCEGSTLGPWFQVKVGTSRMKRYPPEGPDELCPPNRIILVPL